MPQIDKDFRSDIFGQSQPSSSRSTADSTESAENRTHCIVSESPDRELIHTASPPTTHILSHYDSKYGRFSIGQGEVSPGTSAIFGEPEEQADSGRTGRGRVKDVRFQWDGKTSAG